jgi:hypothetical protein
MEKREWNPTLRFTTAFYHNKCGTLKTQGTSLNKRPATDFFPLKKLGLYSLSTTKSSEI